MAVKNQVLFAFATLLCATSVYPQPVLEPSASDETSEEQSNEDDTAELEVVVVTGTKMPGVNLDRSGIGASVLSATDLESARIDSVSDLARVLPNLSVQRLGQVGGLFLTVRGIASNPFVVNRVAVYVDDVPYRELNDLLLEDLERVEFLRGPQSSLYGLNPEAGAIVISSARPGDFSEGVASASYKSYSVGGGVWSGRATASGPITDRVAGRITVAGTTGDAFTRNLGASDGREGEVEEFAARGRLALDLTDRLFGDLTIGYERLDAPGIFEQEYLPVDRDLYNALYADLFNDGIRLRRNELFQDAAKSTQEENFNTSFRLRYALDDFQIVSVSAYRKEDDRGEGAEFDLTGLPLFRGADDDSKTLFSQELRAAASADSAVKWVIGVTYLLEDDRQQLATQDLAAGAQELVPASDQTRDGRDVAIFGQAILPVAPALRLTLGGRYEWARRSSLQQEQVFNLPTGTFIIPAVDLTTNFEQFLPKAALEFDLTPDWLLYASASRGWLPGGFNLSAVAPDIADSLVQFDRETLWSYEAGVKTQLADGRLRASAAAFWIDARNWQEFAIATTPTGAAASTTVVTSDADVRSRGIEAELAWFPATSLDVALAGSYTDSEYTRYVFGPGIDYSGNRPAFAPEFEIKARTEWRFMQNFAARASVSLQGDTPLNAENSVVQKTYTLVDASVSWSRGPFTATLFAENLTDRAYFSGLAFDNFAFGRDGVRYAPVGAPRTVGLELQARW